jgi:hypothetical protein
LLAAAICTPIAGQLNSLSSVLSVTPPKVVAAKRNQTVSADIKLELRQGYHVNSDKPTDEYLIPLKLTWTPGAAESAGVDFPAPVMQKFSFSEKPLSVFEGDFKLTAKFKIPANAPVGPSKLEGKLRYQACNDRMCLPPRTLDVIVPLEIQN